MSISYSVTVSNFIVSIPALVEITSYSVSNFSLLSTVRRRRKNQGFSLVQFPTLMFPYIMLERHNIWTFTLCATQQRWQEIVLRY